MIHKIHLKNTVYLEYNMYISMYIIYFKYLPHIESTKDIVYKICYNFIIFKNI